VARKLIFPQGKEFALAIIDDTDNGTVENLRPIYDLLHKYGLRTTKTTWVRYPQIDLHWRNTDTLERPEYLAFILDLKRKGFEIAWHGPAGESSTREQVIEAIEKFESLIGHEVTLHVNHQRNLDNLYWGLHQLPVWRRKGLLKVNEPASEGHLETSKYFWGDIAKKKIKYTRANVYNEINTLKCDPYMPYHNPRHPYVNAWFSCANGDEFVAFSNLMTPSNLKRLQSERGLSIVYTHFGSRNNMNDPNRWLNEHGEPKPQVEEIFYMLSKMNGWYAPASELLDFLSAGDVRVVNPLQRIRYQLLKYVYG
jgi:hypothetical protein